MLLSFAIYDDDGAPVTGASPTFAVFVDDSGAAAVAPPVSEFGGGLYGFEVADGAVRAYLVSTGANPAHIAGSVGAERFVAFPVFDAGGAPLAGAAPAISGFYAADGTPIAAPTIAQLGAGLYAFTAPADNVAYHVTTGAFPAEYSGSVGVAVGDVVPPVLSHFDPPVGDAITATSPLSFRVTDDSGDLRRTIITVEFPGSGTVEVAHTGDDFAPNYTGTRDVITGGYEFTGLQRVGGWPSSPTLRAYVTDPSGNEAL